MNYWAEISMVIRFGWAEIRMGRSQWQPRKSPFKLCVSGTKHRTTCSGIKQRRSLLHIVCFWYKAAKVTYTLCVSGIKQRRSLLQIVFLV